MENMNIASNTWSEWGVVLVLSVFKYYASVIEVYYIYFLKRCSMSLTFIYKILYCVIFDFIQGI